VPRRQPKVVDRVGAVVGQPRFSPGISAHRNLSLLARSRGVSAARVEEVIGRVGLSGRVQDRYRGYSPGMRQRLAIASGLLKSPELLILDEPTTGLAAADVRDIRELVRELGREGITVLLGTHVLAEVQQVCDTVSILGQGRLLSTGTVAELVGRAPAGPVRVAVREVDEAARHLVSAGFQVSREGSQLYVEGADDPSEISRLLAGHDIHVRELVAQRADLDAVVHQLQQEPAPPAPPASSRGASR
jgi:ABC-2 type transport system ATP-binding protein